MECVDVLANVDSLQIGLKYTLEFGKFLKDIVDPYLADWAEAVLFNAFDIILDYVSFVVVEMMEHHHPECF